MKIIRMTMKAINQIKKYEPLIKKITFDDDEITQMQSLERSYFASINNNILSLKLDNTKYLNINYKMFIDFINKKYKKTNK